MADTAGTGSGGPAPDGLDAVPPAAPASRDDDWIGLLADGSALDGRRDLFDAAFDALATTVEVDPQASDTLGRVLEKRLANVPIETALAEATEALKNYLGVDAAYLVHWLAYAETVDRLARVEAVAPQEVSKFLRRLLSESGSRIDLAQRGALLGPDDWLQVFKNAYADMLTGKYVFSLTVVKLDGSKLKLDCAADSLLRLTSHLLELVNSVPASSVYSPSPLEHFTLMIAESARLVGLQAEGSGEDDSLRGANRLERALDDQEGR